MYTLYKVYFQLLRVDLKKSKSFSDNCNFLPHSIYFTYRLSQHCKLLTLINEIIFKFWNTFTEAGIPHNVNEKLRTVYHY